MYNKKPEQFTAFDDEINPDTSKEREKSDRKKFVDAIRLWSEATNLYEQNREETLEIIKDLVDATEREDLDEISRCAEALVQKNKEQMHIWIKQHEKCANLFPKEFQPMREEIENIRKRTGEGQPVDDETRRTLQSLTNDELNKFTV